jgi:glycosyltransferase involved in cell wall biosynthesis
VRVAFVLTQASGGPAALTVALASELSARADGPDVAVFGPRVDKGGDGDGRNGAETPPPLGQGALMVEVAVRSKTDLAGARRLRDRLRSWKPDIVHAQDRRAGLLAVTVARTGVPVVSTYHGVPYSTPNRLLVEGGLTPVHLPGPRHSFKGQTTLVADGLVARAADATVVPSAAMAGFLAKVVHVAPRRARVIHNGVAFAAPSPRTNSGPSRVFITVGTVMAHKGTRDLLKAFAVAARRTDGLRLIVVGDGDDLAACRQLASISGISDQVEFTGFRTDVRAQLARADAFVLPSLLENLPLALLEAMGAGLACVATDVGGVSEVLDETTGLVVGPGDAGALAAAMTRLAEEPGLADALRSRAAEVARTRFSISVCTEAHRQLYEDLLTTPP